MAKQEFRKFESLNLDAGRVLQAFPDPSNPKFTVSICYVGCIPGQSIIISQNEAGEFPNLQEGQSIVLRALMPDGVAVFTARVLYLTDMPLHMAFIDLPEKVQFQQVRRQKRVRTKLPVLVSGENGSSHRNLDASLLDISLSGARLSSPHNFANTGDAIHIRGKFQVGPIKRVLAIKANVRSKETSNSGSAIYGVEFVEENEDDLLVLFGFIFNEMVFGEYQTLH